MYAIVRMGIAALTFLTLTAMVATEYGTQVFGVGYDGVGGWDYLAFDETRGHLFVSRGSHVRVFDTKTTTSIGDITDTPGVRDIAFAQNLGLGFVSDSGDDSITIFDLASLGKIAKVAIAGKQPDALAYDPATQRVFVFDDASEDATVLDARTHAVVATLPLGGKPAFAVADGSGNIYANIASTSRLIDIDAASHTIAHTWSLTTCQTPSGLAIDPAHHRLFAGCANAMVAVLDSERGTVVTKIPTGAGTGSTAFDPATQLVFAANGRDATVTVAHEDSPNAYAVTQTVATLPLARTMVLDPTQHTLWLSLAKLQPVSNHGASKQEIIEGSFTLLEVLPKDLQRKLYQ